MNALVDKLGDDALTMAGDARRLWHAHYQDLRYVEEWNTWIVWDAKSGRWVEDRHQVRAINLALRSVERLYPLVPDVPDHERKQLIAHANRATGDRHLVGVLKLLAGQPGITVGASSLDAHPWLLNTPTGTIDLRTGAARGHDPLDLLTMSTRARFDLDAAAPAWDAFLERVQPDAEVRSYLARLVGYSLIGEVREHVFVANVGDGANGKSTFRDSLRQGLGDYAATARRDLLLESKYSGRHDATRYQLVGRRFVAVSEMDDGEMLASGEMKELTGGEAISVRKLYGMAWEVEPTWKLWLGTNRLPRVRDTSDGTWRRMRVVPWPVTIPEDERDPGLPARLRAEADGILAWALRGLADYLTIGLAEPASIIVATESYRAHEDLVGRFLIDTGLVIDPADKGARITAAELSERLRLWCDDNGERLGARKLTEELERRGARKGQTADKAKQRIWRCVRVADTADTTTPNFPRETSYRKCGGDASAASADPVEDLGAWSRDGLLDAS